MIMQQTHIYRPKKTYFRRVFSIHVSKPPWSLHLICIETMQQVGTLVKHKFSGFFQIE